MNESFDTNVDRESSKYPILLDCIQEEPSEANDFVLVESRKKKRCKIEKRIIHLVGTIVVE